MAKLNYQGKTVYYQELGPNADGPIAGIKQPVLLLHGNTASGKMFDFVLEDCIAQWGRIMVIDFLGHGRSDRLAKFPDDLWQDQARQVIALVEQEGLREVILIGTSGGAITAVNAALLRPDLFAAVIADSFQGGQLSTGQVELIDAERGEKLAAEAPPVPEGDADEMPDTAFWEYCHGADWAQIVACDSELLARLAGRSQSLLAAPLSELAVPTLFTALQQDELIPDSGAIAEACAKKAQRGQFHIFATGSHPSMLTNWETFVPVVTAFLVEL